MVFFRHNTGKTIDAGNSFEETIDLASYGFAKRPIPVALPDYGQFFEVSYAWPADGNTSTLRIECLATLRCIVSYGLLLLEPM